MGFHADNASRGDAPAPSTSTVFHGAVRFLKPGVAFADLDRAAHAVSDLAALREVNRARAELFRTIGLAPGGSRRPDLVDGRP